MNYLKFRRKHKLSSGDMISFVRADYPKFSKVQLSMVDHPEKYGVRLTSASEKKLRQKYSAPAKPRRKKQCSNCANFTDDSFCLHWKAATDFAANCSHFK